MENSFPRCRGCDFLIHSRVGYNRKKYWCIHPDAKKRNETDGQLHSSFVGFGDTSYSSPLRLKTCKRWCPLLKKGGQADEQTDIQNS